MRYSSQRRLSLNTKKKSRTPRRGGGKPRKCTKRCKNGDTYTTYDNDSTSASFDQWLKDSSSTGSSEPNFVNGRIDTAFNNENFISIQPSGIQLQLVPHEKPKMHANKSNKRKRGGQMKQNKTRRQ